MERPIKQRYITSAAMLIVASVAVKIIGAVYKIPLTAYIGSVGRGYFGIAYNLLMPVHAIIMGAFPVALSKLVSKSLAKGDIVHAGYLKKAANRLFFIVGICGMAFMLIFAKPYADLISSSPKSIYTILVLLPSALFSSMAASRRSYAEGYMNMVPTSVSQIIDALFKMIFGLLFARLSMSYLYDSYITSGAVFGVVQASEQEALSFIYPFTSAAAMVGVTAGDFFSMLYVMLYVKIKYNQHLPRRSANGDNVSDSMSELWHFSLPLIAATVIQSIAAFLDTAGIQYCLTLCDSDKLRLEYNAAMTVAGVTSNDMRTYLFGLYSSVLDFKNLVPGVTMSLGVAAVPALSAAYENASDRFSLLLTSILKYTSILAAGGGAAIALFSSDILSLFYSGSNPDIVIGGARLLFWMGVSIAPACIASTAVFAAQSLGLASRLIAPFVVSAAVRLLLDFICVSDERINLFGGIISSFAGYIIILVWSMAVMKKSVNVKYKYSAIFVKPFAAAGLTYFLTSTVYNSLICHMDTYLTFFVSVFVYVMFFVILLFLLGSVELKDIRFVNIS